MILALAAAAAIGAPLQAVLTTLQSRDAVRGREVTEAIASSPALARQLGDLASAGQLRDIVVLPADLNQPFRGAPRDGAIRLEPSLFEKAAAFKAVHHLDPLVFFVGYQGAKIASQAKLATDDQAAKSLLRDEGPPGHRSIDATAFMLASQKAHARDDARAAIVGWNDSFDAAITARGGPPSQPQGVELIRDQPYANLLIASATRKEKPLRLPFSLTIAETPDNIDAVAETLLAPPAKP